MGNNKIKKAVCILSGGMDSTLASYIAKKNGYEIESEGKILFGSIKHFIMKKILVKERI